MGMEKKTPGSGKSRKKRASKLRGKSFDRGTSGMSGAWSRGNSEMKKFERQQKKLAKKEARLEAKLDKGIAALERELKELGDA